jgi:hypothetical protein
MPRVSAADKLERRLIEDLEQQAFDSEVPAYVRHRCKATLATMLSRRDKRLALKAQAAAARRAIRDEAERASRYVSHLPDNGRMIRD